MAITVEGMRAFRRAGTLAAVLPEVRVTVRDGHRTLLTVSRQDVDDALQGDGLVVAPCRFRAAVAHALRRQADGGHFTFLDLDRDPGVEVRAPSGGDVPPCGIYRAPVCGGRVLHVFVSGLGVRACHDAFVTMSGVTDPATGLEQLDPGEIDGEIGFHGDPAMCMTAVHAVSASGDAEATHSVMHRLLEVCTAAEIIAQLGG